MELGSRTPHSRPGISWSKGGVEGRRGGLVCRSWGVSRGCNSSASSTSFSNMSRGVIVAQRSASTLFLSFFPFHVRAQGGRGGGVSFSSIFAFFWYLYSATCYLLFSFFQTGCQGPGRVLGGIYSYNGGREGGEVGLGARVQLRCWEIDQKKNPPYLTYSRELSMPPRLSRHIFSSRFLFTSRCLSLCSKILTTSNKLLPDGGRVDKDELNCFPAARLHGLTECRACTFTVVVGLRTRAFLACRSGRVPDGPPPLSRQGTGRIEIFLPR